MARAPKGYWEKRQTELMKRLEKGTENTINSLVEVYEQATKNINKEIVKIFRNYAKDSTLDRETLQQLLTKKESDIYYKNLLQVINNNITDNNIKKKLLAKYNAPAYSYRISRYQALQQNIDIELKKLANMENKITKVRYIDTINETYYRNIFNAQQNLGFAFSFAQIDNRTINLLLNENWTNNENFSQRIWNNSEKLSNYLKMQFSADTISGKSIQKISKELSEYMNVGLYNATTLVRTEVNHFANEAEMLAYEELDIEKYRFIATLDNVTCDHCARLDNQVFFIKDRKAGKNYPPIHPNDRCTTVAEFDDNNLEKLQRRAKDENGETILVPQDMNYEEWKKKNVKETSVLKELTEDAKINKNKQWKKFKTLNEAKDYVYSNYKDSDIDKINNIDSINITFKTLNELQTEYPLNREIYVRNKTMSGAAAQGSYQGIFLNTAHFNKAKTKAMIGNEWLESLEKQIEDLKQYLGNTKYKQKPIENGIRRLEMQKKYNCFSISSSYSDLESLKATITHEYGHVVADQYFGQINKFNANKNFDYFESNECWQKCQNVTSVYKKALDNGDIYNISYYASTNEYEFFAECFAKKQMGETIPDYINEMLERVLKNEK